MDVFAEMRERDSGAIRCGLSTLTDPAVSDVAAEFGLRPDRRIYREVDAATARALVCDLLHRDMAYDDVILPLADADRLAAAFVELFGPAALFFSNGRRPPEVPGDRTGSNSWSGATDSTFDAGVIAIGPDRAGCVWAEDED